MFRRGMLLACSLAWYGSVGTFTLHGLLEESPTPNVVFGAVPKKRTFHGPEKITFEFEIRNVGRTPVLLARPSLHYVVLHINGPGRKESPWCGRIDGRYVSRSDFAVVPPGGLIRREVIISCDEKKIRGYAIQEPGKYSVDAVYLVPQPVSTLRGLAGSAQIVRGPLKARSVDFWIVSSRPND